MVSKSADEFLRGFSSTFFPIVEKRRSERVARQNADLNTQRQFQLATGLAKFKSDLETQQFNDLGFGGTQSPEATIKGKLLGQEEAQMEEPPISTKERFDDSDPTSKRKFLIEANKAKLQVLSDEIDKLESRPGNRIAQAKAKRLIREADRIQKSIAQGENKIVMEEEKKIKNRETLFKEARGLGIDRSSIQDLPNQEIEDMLASKVREREAFKKIPGLEKRLQTGEVSLSDIPSNLSPEERVAELERRVPDILSKEGLKKKAFANNLNNFFALDDVIHQERGEGLGRFIAGPTLAASGVLQMNKVGRAVAAKDAVSKQLRVQIVRAAGDVGNMNIIEQEAAEKIIPSIFDDKGTADIKRAFLSQLAEPVNSNNASAVKQLLNSFAQEIVKNPVASEVSGSAQQPGAKQITTPDGQVITIRRKS